MSRVVVDLESDCMEDKLQMVLTIGLGTSVIWLVRNENPKPYRWKAKGEEMQFVKIKKAKDVLAADYIILAGQYTSGDC